MIYDMIRYECIHEHAVEDIEGVDSGPDVCVTVHEGGVVRHHGPSNNTEYHIDYSQCSQHRTVRLECVPDHSEHSVAVYKV